MARLCGICRRAPREDDPMGTIRLAPADLEGVHGVEPGLYHACTDCIDAYRPSVARRLVAEGVLAREEDVTPQYLM